MTPPEITIAALVYAASFLLGQRLLALGVPDLLEVSFLIAAILGSVTAAVLYYRQQYRGTERGTRWAGGLRGGGWWPGVASRARRRGATRAGGGAVCRAGGLY